MKLYKAYYENINFKVINNPLFHICLSVHETAVRMTKLLPQTKAVSSSTITVATY